jgi:hypothetical protein
MTPDTFEKPIRILVGLGQPKDIRTVLDAYMILNDAPSYIRNAAQMMALKVCKAALLGEVEAETARGAFKAFARKHDLLAPEADNWIAAAAVRRSDPHIR